MEQFPKLKRSVIEPKVYALAVRSVRGQVVHLGVHYSLEEAYAAARKRMEALATHKPGEAMDIELWDSMPARQMMGQLMDSGTLEEMLLGEDANIIPMLGDDMLFGELKDLPEILETLLKRKGAVPSAVKEVPVAWTEPTLDDHIQDVKESKNDLMRKLIEDGDATQVESVKDLLGSASKRYVLKAIEKKTSAPEKK